MDRTADDRPLPTADEVDRQEQHRGDEPGDADAALRAADDPEVPEADALEQELPLEAGDGTVPDDQRVVATSEGDYDHEA